MKFPTYLGFVRTHMPKFPTFPDLFDECKQITIPGLRLLGYLRTDAIVSGTYRWTCGGKPSGSISVKVNLSGRYMDLDYNYGDKPVSYRVELVSIPKHFGGVEWYFICPATGKRSRTLYGLSERFLSRFAYPSAMYSKQTKSKRWRAIGTLFEILWIETPFEKKYSRTHYKGKPTKRFKSWLAKHERQERIVLDRKQLGPLFN